MAVAAGADFNEAERKKYTVGIPYGMYPPMEMDADRNLERWLNEYGENGWTLVAIYVDRLFVFVRTE